MKFIITVDTEADNQWKISNKLSLDNIKYLSRFQKLCQDYNFIPTYLLTYEVASDEESVLFFKRLVDEGKAEIGAHLHTWTTPPFAGEEMEEMTRRPFLSELTDEQLKLKLENLTLKIKENFGFSPISFRAGRWDFDSRLVSILNDLNYEVDCSATPKIMWKNRDNYFYKSSINPFKLGDSSLLEIPVSIIYTGIFVKESSSISGLFLRLNDGFLKKVINRFFLKLSWCRIFPETKSADLINVFKSASRNNLPVLEFMIHSSELMPGGSPYFKTKESIDSLYFNLEVFFKYLSSNNVEGSGLVDFSKKFSSKIS